MFLSAHQKKKMIFISTNKPQLFFRSSKAALAAFDECLSANDYYICI